jgi:iron complex transport system ATP-binding protein
MDAADRAARGVVAPALSLRNASVEQRLKGVSLTLRAGECFVVVGPNGAGKSTLLRALAGLERLTSGEARLDERALSSLEPRERAGFVAFLPQRPELGEPVRIDELVSSGRYRFAESHGESLSHARRALAELSAAHLAERFSDRISGGELQRALLATVLAQEAPLLLVDEPGNHLDPAQQIAIYGSLGELWRHGRGLLLVTHDLNLAKHLGPAERVRVLGIEHGELRFDTTLDSPTLARALSQLYGVDFSEILLESGRHFVPTAGARKQNSPGESP